MVYFTKLMETLNYFFLNRQRNLSLSHKPKLKGFLTFENFHIFSTCNATFYIKHLEKIFLICCSV